MKKDRPYVKIDNWHSESQNPIIELNNDAIKRIEEHCQKYRGLSLTSETIMHLQTSLDTLCGGQRLFEVKKKYKTQRYKTKIVDADGKPLRVFDKNGNPIENIYREEHELVPWELEVVYVGDLPISRDIEIEMTYEEDAI